MPKTTTAPFTQSNKLAGFIMLSSVTAQSVDTSGVVTNDQLIYTAGADDSVVKSILITSNDSAVRYVSIWVQPGGTGAKYLLNTVAVPVNSGYSPTGIIANVDVLNGPYMQGLCCDQTGRPVLPVSAGTKIYAGLVAGLTSNKQLYLLTISADF
jgi:hypothetical protein